MALKTIEDYPLTFTTAKDISDVLIITKPTAYEIMEKTDFPLIKIGRCKRRDAFFQWIQNTSI